MKRTNTNEYKKLIEKHILECITSEYVELVTPEDKINFFFSEFNRVANHEFNLKRLPNNQERMADFIAGIPFSFEYTNHGIIELCEELHECKLTDKQAETCVSNYNNHIAQNIIRMQTKYIKQ